MSKKLVRWWTVWAAVALFASACGAFWGWTQWASHANRERTLCAVCARREKIAIWEAVVRYEMRSLYPSRVYFLSLRDWPELAKDPPPALLARLRGGRRLVKPGSAFRRDAFTRGSMAAFEFRYGGKTAAQLFVGDIEPSNGPGCTVRVNGGAQCGGQCGTFGVFVVTRSARRWRVTRYEDQLGI